MVRAALAQKRRIGQGPVPAARFVPAVSVMAASLLAALPIVSTSGWFPDFGFLVLIAWRLLRSDAFPAWPDLVLIDGGKGQVAVAARILEELQLSDLPMLGVAKGPERKPGWEVLHVAIDDATRLVYAELLPDERRYTTAHFAVRALRWFRSQGIVVERLLTDNGSAYRSRVFGRLVRRLGIAHKRTRPYRPQTNGKVERWIRTVLSECLYLEVFASSEQRRRALQRFVAYYNDRRPHLAFKGGPPPRRRLAQLMAAA